MNFNCFGIQIKFDECADSGTFEVCDPVESNDEGAESVSKLIIGRFIKFDGECDV